MVVDCHGGFTTSSFVLLTTAVDLFKTTGFHYESDGTETPESRASIDLDDLDEMM